MIRPALITSPNFPMISSLREKTTAVCPRPAVVIHVHAHLERLIDGFRPIHREHREQLLDRQRMFAAHALNRRNQQLRARLDRKPDDAGDVGRLLPDRHRLRASGVGIDHRARQQRRLLLVADVRAQLREFLQHRVVDLIVDHHRLLGGADRSVVERLGGDDVHHRHVQVRGLLQVDRRVSRPHPQGRLAGAVGGLDHARPAGGVDQRDVLVAHQVGVVLPGWAIPGR